MQKFKKQQQANIRKLYKHQYNTQNKQYKSYKEQIINQTPKDQVREKLEQIKDEQNRKFSLLYEHYKTNVDAVLQQQNLKLNATQQLEQDQLNDDLERQMNVLYQSHLQRKKHQAETFAKETEQLDAERLQKHKDLKFKMDNENEEFEKTGKQRLNKLVEMQRIILEKLDKDCFDSYGVQTPPQNNNRFSVFNLIGTPNNGSSNYNNLNYSTSMDSNETDFNLQKAYHSNSKLKSSTSSCSNKNEKYYLTEGLSLSSTTSSVISSSSASNPSHSTLFYNNEGKNMMSDSYQQLYQFQPNQGQSTQQLQATPYGTGNQQQPQQQNLIYSIEPYLAHANSGIVNPTSLSYTSASSSTQNSNRRNSTAFS